MDNIVISGEDILTELQRLRKENKALKTKLEQEAIEKIQANEINKETHLQMEAMFELNQAVILIIEPDNGFIVDSNQAASNFYGYSKEQLCSMKIQDISLLPSSEVEIELNLAKNLKKNYRVFRQQVFGGEIKTVEVFSTPTKFFNKLVLFSIIHDITELVQTEKALRESEAEFRELWGATVEGIVIHDNGIILEVNEAICQMFGYTREQVLGKSLTNFATESFHKYILEHISSESNERFEISAIHADGSEVIIEIFPKQVFYKGKTTRMVAIRDITERKRADEELKKSEERYRGIFENVQDIFYETSFDGIILDISPSIVIITKGLYNREFLIGKSINDFYYHKEERDAILQLLIKHGMVNDYEITLVNKDGTLISCSISSNIQFDNFNKPHKIIGSIRDITERKHSEKIVQDIIDKNPMAIQILNMDGFTIQTNPAHTKLFGAITPDDYSIFNDSQLLEQGLGELFDRIKKGEVVYFPDSNFNVHDVDPSFPDVAVSVKAVGFTLNNNNGKPDKIVIMQEDITERKQTEKMLRDIIDKNPMSIQIVDKEGFTLKGNPAYIELFGSVPPPEFSIFVDLQNKSPELALLINRAKSGDVVHLPDVYYNPHDVSQDFPDKPVWIRALIFPLTDNCGKPERFVFMHENITKRKIAEEALIEINRKQEELLQALDNCGTYIFIKDIESRYIYVNKLIREMHNMRLEEIIGLTDESLFPAGAAFQMKNDDLSIINKGEIIRKEQIVFHKDDNEFKTHWIVKLPLRLSDGTINGIIGISTDITELKHAEESLINSENMLKETQLIAGLGSYVIDFTSGICTSSTVLNSIFGLDDIAERPIEQWLSLTHSEWQESMTSLFIDEMIGKQSRLDKEYKITRVNDGVERWVHGIGELIFNEKGEYVRMIGSIMDITERKLAEEKLQIQNKELESQYEEYMQINEVLRQTNYDLELAKIRAEESDRLKTAFLQNISHEIRTPLNGIIGFSKLLANKDISLEEINEFTAIIKQSGDRLIEIVNNILDISRIETGQIVIFNNYFSINSLMSDLFSLFTPIALINNLQLNFHSSLDDENSVIFSDESKINQILTNLINNALKFTNSGSVEYGYEIKYNFIQFYVKDTGIGISGDLHKKIFERFTQAEDTIGRTFEGAGLGLAICKGLVEMLGGNIWLESEINIGTTFFFTIPFKFKTYIEQIDHLKTNINENKNKFKILIAEDDFTSFKFICKVLKNNDFIILQAVNGEQAVDLVKNIPDIDLIMMDIRMPVMDGFEATKQIKRIRPGLPIIAQTAYAFTDEKNKILSAGCDEYLSKPIEINKLMKLIEKYLK